MQNNKKIKSLETDDFRKRIAKYNSLARQIEALEKFAEKQEIAKNEWKEEHDRVVAEYQHRLAAIAASALEGIPYPEKSMKSNKPTK